MPVPSMLLDGSRACARNPADRYFSRRAFYSPGTYACDQNWPDRQVSRGTSYLGSRVVFLGFGVGRGQSCSSTDVASHLVAEEEAGIGWESQRL